MSLRQQSKILGMAPSYLSMMVNGKRPWKPEIKHRYDQLVNSIPKSVHKTVHTESGRGGAGTCLLGTETSDNIMAPRKGLEPSLSYREADLSPFRGHSSI